MEKTLVPQALHADGKTTVPQALHTSNAENLPQLRISADESTTCNASLKPPQPLNPLPKGFHPDHAYLLGQCCLAAGDQYSKYVENTPQGNPNDPDSWQIKAVESKPWNLDLSQIEGYKPQQPYILTVYEKKRDDTYVEIPAGFIVQLDPTDVGEGKNSMIVVAFHGTQNKYEADTVDNRVAPAPFKNQGSVHGGFYDHYYKSPTGSTLQEQIHNFFEGTLRNRHAVLPVVKVTGHSMGGALATLCAVDIAGSFDFLKDKISMYSLASPRVADALADKNDRGDAATFVSYYQRTVPDSYRIVNTEDLVPKNPPALGKYVCAHVLGESVPNIVKPSALDDNLVSFADKNDQNTKDNSPSGCQGTHSCRAVYLPFLKSLTKAS